MGFQLEELFIAFLGVQQPLRRFRRHLSGRQRLARWVLILLLFAAWFSARCRRWLLFLLPGVFLVGLFLIVLVLRLRIWLRRLLILLVVLR